jgi:hypothetical protein
MKNLKKFLLIPFLAALAFIWQPDPVLHAQRIQYNGLSRFSNEFDAANFGKWALRASSGSATAGTYSLSFPAGGYVTTPQGQSFTPFTVTTRITVGIGAVRETVTPTSVSGCGISSVSVCTVTAVFSFAHGAGTPVISGSGGFDEATNIANQNGGGVVLVSNNTSITDALITASTAIFPNVQVESFIGSANPTFYQITPTTLTALATPAVRTAAAACPTPIVATTVCDNTAVVGTFTAAAQFVCVFYVDQMGQKSPCSTTANYTSAGSVGIFFASPAASTGAVGWGAAIGITGLSTAYQMPIPANCPLSVAENVTPAIAMGQSCTFTTPTTATALHPGYVVNTYNPNDVTHTTWAYQARNAAPICGGLMQDWTPFLATAGGTTTQKQVIGSVEIPNGCLNQIGKTLRVSGKVAMTNGTSETPQFLIQLGPSFTTGTPTNICTLTDTTALTAAANSTEFTCTMTTNATGSSGTIMPGGFALTQLQAGTTAGAGAVDSATAAITDNIAGTTTLYITYIGSGGTSTAVQLMDLHLEMP